MRISPAGLAAVACCGGLKRKKEVVLLLSQKAHRGFACVVASMSRHHGRNGAPHRFIYSPICSLQRPQISSEASYRDIRDSVPANIRYDYATPVSQTPCGHWTVELAHSSRITVRPMVLRAAYSAETEPPTSRYPVPSAASAASTVGPDMQLPTYIEPWKPWSRLCSKLKKTKPNGNTQNQHCKFRQEVLRYRRPRGRRPLSVMIPPASCCHDQSSGGLADEDVLHICSFHAMLQKLSPICLSPIK